MREPLAKIDVASMSAKLPNGPGIAPGQKRALIAQFTEPNGKVLITEGKGGGKIMWKDLTVAGAVVDVNTKGIVSLRADPRYSDGKTGHVTITAPSHPNLRADLDIPFRYDVAFTANFSGTPGASGTSGMDGTNGTSGSSGSMDPNNPSPGGDGGNGTDGSDGGDGGPGGNAPNVLVRATVRPGNHPMLEVSVSAAGDERFFLIDTQGGSLLVKADGGAGGSGGRGGRGGSGGSGGMGTPSGNSGMSGHDGRNGFDGSPGKAGSIRVAYDPQVKPFLSVIHLSNKGGPGPTFQEEPVAELW
ncbi:MAG TPA: hypothetical protein VN025_19125 [Candidatus Dormibacteraeota bacterium]|nr:hypothetical protein [Candidatus Dormibacteraeota bacterium]